MKIELRVSNVPISEPLELHIVRRLHFALRRYAERVEHIVVRLVDLNGPKGGPDKRCTMSARLSTLGEPVIVEATDADAYVAVSQAGARLDARIARALRRAWLEPRRAASSGPDLATISVVPESVGPEPKESA